jgi:FMN reductase
MITLCDKASGEQRIGSQMAQATRDPSPLVVGIGGTTRPNSSSEIALRLALQAAADAGARTQAFLGTDIEFPIYAPERAARDSRVLAFLDAVRLADAVIISSPGYHGSISGLIKNGLDYMEDMRGDTRPYLEGRAVGCIVCAHGWQATGTTLSALRDVVHALRGWPTPLGATINTSTRVFEGGRCVEEKAAMQLATVGRQVVEFARLTVARSVGEAIPAPGAVPDAGSSMRLSARAS